MAGSTEATRQARQGHASRAACIVVVAMAAVVLARVGLAAQVPLPDKSEVAFVSTQIGAPVEGSFSRFVGRVDLDPKAPQAGSVTFSVDMASVQFPSAEVLAELAKPDWFDTAHFPKADFRSSAIRALAPGRFEVAGTLTIKGRTRPVVFPVELHSVAGASVAAGLLSIKRLDFGIGGGEWGDTSVVEDEVKIRFKITLGPAPG
jgi:polyisoprenoid-binding protein YceI